MNGHRSYIGPAKRMQRVDATSSDIVESNMLLSFHHHVAPCYMMLDNVEHGSLISIKHLLQHEPRGRKCSVSQIRRDLFFFFFLRNELLEERDAARHLFVYKFVNAFLQYSLL